MRDWMGFRIIYDAARSAQDRGGWRVSYVPPSLQLQYGNRRSLRTLYPIIFIAYLPYLGYSRLYLKGEKVLEKYVNIPAKV